MRDFTQKIYQDLLIELKNQKYEFVTFEDYLSNSNNPSKLVILRHDVDKLPQSSLQTAQIEAQLGIKGVYYFRIVKESNQPDFIKAICELGHEIGYHYEDLTLAKGDIQKAAALFINNLTYFRSYYPVRTICMHGSPLTKWDNKDIWKVINYKDFGIIGEPYYDLDFNNFQYFTDTGRRWDGEKVSVRDKVDSKHQIFVRNTQQLIQLVQKKTLSDNIMITVHPQRWENKIIPWTIEYISQNLKNTVKYLINLKKRM